MGSARAAKTSRRRRTGRNASSSHCPIGWTMASCRPGYCLGFVPMFLSRAETYRVAWVGGVTSKKVRWIILVGNDKWAKAWKHVDIDTMGKQNNLCPTNEDLMKTIKPQIHWKFNAVDFCVTVWVLISRQNIILVVLLKSNKIVWVDIHMNLIHHAKESQFMNHWEPMFV